MHWPATSPYLLAFSLILLVYPTSASTITAAPHLARRQAGENSPSCAGFYSLESSCSYATTNFLNLSFDQQASCLCYSSSQWVPSVFDGYFATCLSYLATASPAVYSAVVGTGMPTAPCAAVATTTTSGTPATTNGTPTPVTTSFDANVLACSSLDLMESSCSQFTPSFTDLPFSVEASCLCYSGSTYAPSIFDRYWGSCLAYIQTADPSLYTVSLSGSAAISNPCVLEGDVRQTPTITTAGSTGPTNSASSGASLSSSSIQQTTASPSSSQALTTTGPSQSSASHNGAISLRNVDMSIAALAVLFALVFVS
jgi:hypothetical protein